MEDDEPGCIVDLIPEDALLLAHVEIVRFIDDKDRDVVMWRGSDSGGCELPLIEILGMLRLTEDTVIRERMGDDGD